MCYNGLYEGENNLVYANKLIVLIDTEDLGMFGNMLLCIYLSWELLSAVGITAVSRFKTDQEQSRHVHVQV